MLDNTNLKGKVAIVTGGYSGIGYETVLQLLKWNCKVVICGRNKTKATNAIEKLKSTNSFDPSNLSFIEMDLDNLLSVKKAVELFEKTFDRLDFLINNAGIWTSKLTLTSFNLEAHFSSNFLGHFYLTKLLLNLVKKTGGRIINVSSIAHFKYDPNTDPILETKSTTSLDETFTNCYYGRSKLYNVWFTNAVQRRLNVDAKNVVCVSLAPGVVTTQLLWPLARAHFYFIPKYINLLVLKRPVDGAATTLFLCATDAKNLLPGGYYDNMRLAFVSKYAHDHQREEKLYSFAEELVNKLAK
ncbi:hypothetical protein MACJ_003068 [Theileria orientalis]|uniref:Short-chain dehydrogenase/reductase n=1 Tax=Theileria orientalis TaxID=68886 RepID=A0A976M780_THEOR|nr:hypothetical protein MACJ_003068 [Theileria orientalis]